MGCKFFWTSIYSLCKQDHDLDFRPLIIMPTVDYRINNKKVPTTTQILSRYKNSTPLIIWANRLGLDGKDYFTELKNAGDIGTALHDYAEMEVKGEYYELPKDEKILNCYNQFIQWWEQQKYDVTWTEKHFCSEKYLYGGTPDLLVNENTLIDFKTSKGIYSDYLLQGSAYRQLIEENSNYKIEKFVVCRFPKDNTDTEIREFSKEDLDTAFAYFSLLREAFDLDKQINNLMKTKGKNDSK
tara:strand:- start:6553 stop:7275 length:723 start_codon:yes stop_codon:yes gene_type:complete